ncbi:MAG: DUF2469 domain-containing protein [Actinobacteria bacterium]|nr:DUF2469 domain-containing protein [Actinomycetota bacterium]
MSEEELDDFESGAELQLYREYRDVVGMFTHVVETERRFYLANGVEVNKTEDGWYELILTDAWVWDVYRPGRFVQKVKVVTRRDFNIEELSHKDIFGEGPGSVGV